ncbi:MAG: hypothetical protein EOO50_02360 [Flavobacterium sp.]|uniref:phage holin family protein n=1 Tax=Flavobacterium sp. TaxID=239 RepID=UPI0011F9FD8B|nr:phage holin family protein [Flavobacterium sp.]RZJ68283.1 MAG: hypothetical protein EOO50_02360 [Flavobacterium sp.]
MKEKVVMIQELIDKAETYAKTNIELYKLKAIDKTTDVFSSVASGIVIGVIITFLVIILSIGASLWIGELLGKLYYGFFIVAGFYALLAIILVATKKRVLEVFFNNYIVHEIFKEKKHAGN